MIIYQKDDYQVVQHHLIEVYHIRKWMEGDNPRRYGRHWDYFTIKACDSIDQVNEWFRNNVWREGRA